MPSSVVLCFCYRGFIVTPFVALVKWFFEFFFAIFGSAVFYTDPGTSCILYGCNQVIRAVNRDVVYYTGRILCILYHRGELRILYESPRSRILYRYRRILYNIPTSPKPVYYTDGILYQPGESRILYQTADPVYYTGTVYYTSAGRIAYIIPMIYYTSTGRIAYIIPIPAESRIIYRYRQKPGTSAC